MTDDKKAAPPTPSPELLAANARLLALRAERLAAATGQARRAGETAATAANDQVAPGGSRTNTDETAVSLPDLLNRLPPHLGWGSTAVGAHLRATHLRRKEAQRKAPLHEAGLSDDAAATNPPLPTSLPPAQSVQLHPDIALAILRQQLAAPARLWLLLRWLDTGGQGWLSRADIRAALTASGSPTRLCTDRYLRQLLTRGDGLFWQQDETGKRVWLRSLARVAAGLGVRRLRGRLVAVPVSVLLGSIGAFRAHLYATLHSSRGDEAVPVSRARLQELSGASPRTQQTYETRAGVTAVPCMALGAAVGAADAQETAWQYGRAGFIFTDHNGRHGAVGRQYHARRLPNRYRGPHPASRRPRRLNRKLTDLCHHGDAGNDQGGNRQRGFLLAADGRLAARMWLRANGLATVYWPQAGGQERKGVWVWYERPSLLV